MKKAIKKTLAVVMTAATLLTTSAASMSVFAADTEPVQTASASDITLIEDHSVVDCTHYYKENGNYYFQIKCPKGQFEKISLGLVSNPDGSCMGSVSFKYEVSGIFELRDAYSDDKYDYKWFVVKCSEYPDNFYSSWKVFGIKIFYFDGENSKMATNTSNYSTEQGRGYWLSK